MGSFHQGFQKMIDSRNNDTVSRYKKMTAAAKRALNKLMADLEKIE